MSIDEKKIAEFLDAIPKTGNDKNIKPKLMSVLCRLMVRYREKLPVGLKCFVGLASAYWEGGEGDERKIEDARIKCWEFLGEKGRTTAILDDEDAAVRALICLLYHESQDEDHVAETAEFFLSCIKHIQINDPYVDEIIDRGEHWVKQGSE